MSNARGGLEIDDESELGRRLHREICRTVCWWVALSRSQMRNCSKEKKSF